MFRVFVHRTVRFRENEIDGCILLELDDDILKEDFGLSSKLKRTKILARVKQLKAPPN